MPDFDANNDPTRLPAEDAAPTVRRIRLTGRRRVRRLGGPLAAARRRTVRSSCRRLPARPPRRRRGACRPGLPGSFR